MNDLEIFQLIVENIEDKHPQDQIGITPLHIAVEKREDKTIESAVPFPAPEKGDNRGLSPSLSPVYQTLFSRVP